MYPRAFDYCVARSVEEALELLSRYGDDARALAGGQSLIPLMKLRLASPSRLIDIGRIANLTHIAQSDKGLAVGALATHAGVLTSPIVRGQWPLMADAASVIGDSQVRNWGTVGGALAEADPASDWGAAALALRARLRCASTRGERVLDADGFFIDAYTTRLAPDELITEVIFPTPRQPAAGAYLKLERRAGDFAVVSIALQLTLEKNSVCRDASIALAAAGLTPISALDAAASLIGKELNPHVIGEAAERVAAEAEPAVDIRGSEEYKRAAAAALFKQAVEVVLRRARGEKVEAGHAR